MENNIAALCEELQAAREAKKNLQAQMKELDEMISQLKDDITFALTEQGLEQCVTGGYAYTVYTSYRVEKTCDREELVNLFRLNHQNDLITEYVHPSKLNSFVIKELTDNDELPSWLLGSVLVHEASKLSVRKLNN